MPANAVSQIFVAGKKSAKKLINWPISGFILSRKKTIKNVRRYPLGFTLGTLFFHSKKDSEKNSWRSSGAQAKPVITYIYRALLRRNFVLLKY